MNDYVKSNLVIYFIAICFMIVMFGYFCAICNKYKNSKRVYKWLLAIPYAEGILAMSLVYFVLNSDWKNTLLMIITTIIVISPLAHIIEYYYIPNQNTKMPLCKRVRIILFIVGYVTAVMGVLYYCYINLKGN